MDKPTSMCLLSLLTILSIGLAGPAFGQDLERPAHDKAAYRKAYKQGQDDADRELKEGTALVYTFGHIESFDALDKETGLLYTNFGCVVDDTIEGLVAGHNTRLREHIKAHGYPKNSFKPWEKELFGLSDYFQSRRKKEKPVSVAVGGPTLKSPDGAYTLTPKVTKGTAISGKFYVRLALVLKGDRREPKELFLFSDAEKGLEVFWGPKDSSFVVVAAKDENGDNFTAFDLRTGRTLRSEYGSRLKPPGGVFRDPYDIDRPKAPQ